jgi:hypothetical protein
MRYLVLICFTVLSNIITNAQKQVDFSCIANNWIQGKIMDDGSIVHADQGRGGWDNLQINANHTATFTTGFMCGFGSSKSGKWSINKKKSTITFQYTQKKEFQKRNVAEKIKETKTYKIVRLTAKDIMLEPIPNKYNDQIAFVVVTNQE